MRVVVTGQVGMDKKAFLRRAAAIADRAGKPLHLFHVGERMYAEAPDVPAGRILDLPLSRLNALRRSVFKDILRECAGGADAVVNTHATFRWRHGLFYAFDHDLLEEFRADLYVVLVDNIDRVHARLLRDGHTNHTLKDLMVWREEEVMATELLAQITGGHGRFYILARGDDPDPEGGRPDHTAEALARLLFCPQMKKAYLSFPMTGLPRGGRASARIEKFRTDMKRYFVCFDPGDLEEKDLGLRALAAAGAGDKFVTVRFGDREVRIETSELVAVLSDIDGQIYARDFKLIDQADMIVSFIPELPTAPGGPGRPGISSGVERELQHAHEAAKDVFVIWTAPVDPSPFITETATEVFRSPEQAIEHFLARGYVHTPSPGALFA